MRTRMALKLADIRCEIREVRLNDKPDHMLQVSPKGTVPVLILRNKIIDESIDMQNSEYQYKFACPDREGVEEVKKVLGSIDKAKIVNLNVRYS